MTKRWLWLGCLILCLGSTQAQVNVEVVLPQEQFLPGETLLATVRITNRSGQVLHLGEDENWLQFAVQSNNGLVVAKLAEPHVVGEFDLDSSKVAPWRLDLAPYFNMSQAGRYSVTPTVRIKGWDGEITSRPKSFDIIHGAKLYEQSIGVPISSEATNANPEVRKFLLEQANYVKGQPRLYMRLIDNSGAMTLRVVLIRS